MCMRIRILAVIFQKSVLSAAVFAAAAPVVSEDSPHLRHRGASIDLMSRGFSLLSELRLHLIFSGSQLAAVWKNNGLIPLPKPAVYC